MSKTHFAIGALAGVGAGCYFGAGPAEALGLTAAAALGATLPDADTTSSTASHTLFRLGPVVALCYLAAGAASFLGGWTENLPSVVYAGYIAAAIMLLPVALHVLFGHRGATHSILFWGAIYVGAAAAVADPPARLLAAGVCLGSCAGGILPDAMTPAGVPALWPITSRRFRVMPETLCIATGGLVERLFVRPLAYLSLIIMSLRAAGFSFW